MKIIVGGKKKKKMVIVNNNIAIRIAEKVSRYIDSSMNRATPSVNCHLYRKREIGQRKSLPVMLAATKGVMSVRCSILYQRSEWTRSRSYKVIFLYDGRLYK